MPASNVMLQFFERTEEYVHDITALLAQQMGQGSACELVLAHLAIIMQCMFDGISPEIVADTLKRPAN